MREVFEIIYADGSVVAGHTVTQYRKAPDDGIQFVIVRYKDGHIVKHKCLSEYEYHAATKPGSWTDRENFDDLKARLPEISKLLECKDEGRRRRRR